MTEAQGRGPFGDEADRLERLIEQLTSRPDDRSYADDLQAAVEELEVCREELRVVDEELRAQQAEVRHLRERLRDPGPWTLHVLDGLPIAVCLLDSSGSILHANRRSGEILGVPRSLLAGKPLSTYVALPDRSRFRTAWHDIIAGADERRVDTTLQPRHGEPCTAHIVITPRTSALDGWTARCVLVSGVRSEHAGDVVVRAAHGLLAMMGLPLTRDDVPSLISAALDETVQAVPGATCATLSLASGLEAAGVTATSDLGREMEARQSELDEGPCVDTANTGRGTTSRRLELDSRWPRFGRRAHRAGLGSVITATVEHADGAYGVLAVWGPENAIDPDESSLVTMLAQGCATVLNVARKRAADHLEADLLLDTLRVEEPKAP
ncbi:MAG: PAS domain-containing protein [Actinomycetes bacterium]